MPRVSIYARQSQARIGESAETSLSIQSQIDRCQEHAQRNGWHVVSVHRDHDISGDNPDRPGLSGLMADVAGRNVDIVLVFALARLARDHILQEVLWRQMRQYNVRLLSLTEPAAENDLVRGIIGVVSQEERRRQGAYLKASFQRRAEKGGVNGRAPMGYKREHGGVTIIEDQADTIRELFRRVAAGERMYQVSKSLGIDYSGAGRTIRHKMYTGDVLYRGEPVATDAIPAIVDRATWQAANAILDRTPRISQRTRPVEDRHWLDGLVYHHCGQRMYHAWYAGMPYHVCHWCKVSNSGPGRSLSGRFADRVVRNCLAADLSRVATIDDVLRHAETMAGGHDVALSRKRIDRQRQRDQERHARALERFLAGKIPADIMDAEDARLADAIATHEQTIANLPQPPDVALLTAMHATLQTIAQAAREMPDESARLLVQELGHLVITGVKRGQLWYRPQYQALMPQPAECSI